MPWKVDIRSNDKGDTDVILKLEGPHPVEKVEHSLKGDNPNKADHLQHAIKRAQSTANQLNAISVHLWGREGNFVFGKSERSRQHQIGNPTYVYQDDYMDVGDPDTAWTRAKHFKPKRLEFWFYDEQPPTRIVIRPFTEVERVGLREFCEQWVIKMEKRNPQKPTATPAASKNAFANFLRKFNEGGFDRHKKNTTPIIGVRDALNILAFLTNRPEDGGQCWFDEARMKPGRNDEGVLTIHWVQLIDGQQRSYCEARFRLANRSYKSVLEFFGPWAEDDGNWVFIEKNGTTLVLLKKGNFDWMKSAVERYEIDADLPDAANHMESEEIKVPGSSPKNQTDRTKVKV